MTLPVADAVMARRRTALDELDLFPTPPWATRAFVFEWLAPLLKDRKGPLTTVWEPAAGLGHMVGVLREHFSRVHASDVHDWGPGYETGSFVGGALEQIAQCPFTPDWIITNPPFNQSVEFARRALATATQGVALLCRTGWIEGAERYRELFGPRPPSYAIQYAERVPMVKGRWDPTASTATAYMWFVWDREASHETKLQWLPPGRRERWTRNDDRARFANETSSSLVPLLDGGDQ